MPQISQYQDESPVINVTPVASTARSKEGTAQVIGSVREAIGQEYVALQKEASSASLLHSQMQAEDVLSQAQLDMVKNPYSAEQIAKSTKVKLDAIKDSAIINSEHHQHLDYTLNHQENALKLHAAEISYKRARSFAASQAISSQGELLRDLYNTKDPEAFKQKAQEIVNVNNGLLESGSITPSQHSKMIAPVTQAVDRFNEMWNLAKKPDEETPTAEEANTVLMNPWGNTPIETAQLPTNEKANQIAAHTAQHMSYNDIEASVHRNELAGNISNEDLYNLNDEQFYKFIKQSEGVHNGVVKVNTLTDWRSISNRIATLSANPGLKELEKGELAFLQGVQNRINNGQAADIIKESPRGSELQIDYDFKNGIIQSNIDAENVKADKKDPIVLSKFLTQQRQITNNLYEGRLAIQTGAHIPWDKRTPFTTEETFINQQVFNQGQSPLLAFDKMDKFNQNIGSHFANSMKTKGQQQLLTTYNLQRMQAGFNLPEVAIELSKAQQPGMDKTLLIKTKEEGGIGDKTMQLKIQNSMDPDLVNYLLNTPSKDPDTGNYVYSGSNQISGVTSLCKNYVEYKSLTTGDFKMKDHQDHIDTCLGFYQKGYRLLSNSDGSYNLNLGHMTQPEWDSVTYYAKEDIKKEAIKDRGEYGWETLQDRGGIYLTVTDDKHIIGKDGTGQIIYNKVFSSDYKASAHHTKLTLEQEAERYSEEQKYGTRGIIEQFEKEKE